MKNTPDLTSGTTARAPAVESPSFPGATLDALALAQLMPMHLQMGREGSIVSAGPTMCKLLPPDGHRFGDAFQLTRPSTGEDDVATLFHAAHLGERIFLRMLGGPRLTLRGHGVELGDGTLLLNLGFGIALAEAVRELGLTDGDFAPHELAMELLFLHEANRAVMAELSRFNLRLDEAREQAEVQAFTDPLTGLYNRRGLELALNVALRSVEASRPQGTRGEFALAHLDLDFFKEVNDQHGHAAGDEVLRQVAQVLLRETRNNDTVARYGGDEFVLILSGAGSPAALQALAARIIAGIEQPITVEGVTCRVSASIGIALSTSFAIPAVEQMQEAADAALYRSKHAGRGRASLHGHDEAGEPV
ncbi:GGDEF domain-containing protein [Paracoccus sp. TK19116]|uniref:GGDEF domain-containing protein n=1 Tax=Paracoccus albicereus TaxID=2922394 RepID=A0ABT1MVY4_9RHOB|nr:GGDEF domain-containing protein [Paracoccus albicereus]MCQ0971839.1 GGDEF domain-containing protein [Paracoccus albicereus]